LAGEVCKEKAILAKQEGGQSGAAIRKEKKGGNHWQKKSFDRAGWGGMKLQARTSFPQQRPN